MWSSKLILVDLHGDERVVVGVGVEQSGQPDLVFQTLAFTLGTPFCSTLQLALGIWIRANCTRTVYHTIVDCTRVHQTHASCAGRTR